ALGGRPAPHGARPGGNDTGRRRPVRRTSTVRGGLTWLDSPPWGARDPQLLAPRGPGASYWRPHPGMLVLSRGPGSPADTDGQIMATPGWLDARTARPGARAADPMDDLHRLRDDAPLSLPPGCGGGRADAPSLGRVLRTPDIADRRRQQRPAVHA